MRDRDKGTDTDRHRLTETETERDRDRESERQTDRQRQRQRLRDRESERQRLERQADRQTDRWSRVKARGTAVTGAIDNYPLTLLQGAMRYIIDSMGQTTRPTGMASVRYRKRFRYLRKGTPLNHSSPI